MKKKTPMRYIKDAAVGLDQAWHDIDMAADSMSNRGYVKSLRVMKKVMAVRKEVLSLREQVTPYVLSRTAPYVRTPQARLSKRARRTDRGSSRAGRFTSRRRTSRR